MRAKMSQKHLILMPTVTYLYATETALGVILTPAVLLGLTIFCFMPRIYEVTACVNTFHGI